MPTPSRTPTSTGSRSKSRTCRPRPRTTSRRRRNGRCRNTQRCSPTIPTSSRSSAGTSPRRATTTPPSSCSGSISSSTASTGSWTAERPHPGGHARVGPPRHRVETQEAVMADQPRDVIEVLEHDHREVEEMFTELESLRGASTEEAKSRRKDLAEQVTIELVRHSVAEEVLVYPEVDRKVSKEEADHAREEHAEAEETLQKLDADELATLMAEIRHHIEDEEGEMSPTCGRPSTRTSCARWAGAWRRSRRSRRTG